MNVKWIGCAAGNFRKGRPFAFKPEAIVIHIMDGSFASGEGVFLDATSQKSAHYGISKAGVIHQYVDEGDTAFHAGVVVNPTWPLLKPKVNPNFYTIGIEHEGRPDDIWPDALLQASAGLIGQIASTWNIALDVQHVIRHHEIRASKTCPGNKLTDTQTLLDLVPAGVHGNSIPASLAVRLLRNSNLRSGEPNTQAPILRVMLANTRITAAGFVMGERVNGNPSWYKDIDGNFFWAGATDVPNPQNVAQP